MLYRWHTFLHVVIDINSEMYWQTAEALRLEEVNVGRPTGRQIMEVLEYK